MTTPTSDGKTTAIISYMWIIGLIIAFIMNNSNRDHFATYHIRNMMGLLLFSFGNGVLAWAGIPRIITIPITIILFVLWVIGLIGATKGEKQEIPILGKFFQDWFKSI